MAQVSSPSSIHTRPSRGRQGYHPRDSGAEHPTYFVRLPPKRELTEGLSQTVKRTLERPTVSMNSGDVPIKPENLKYVASYNWVDESRPTIIVPGVYCLQSP